MKGHFVKQCSSCKKHVDDRHIWEIRGKIRKLLTKDIFSEIYEDDDDDDEDDVDDDEEQDSDVSHRVVTTVPAREPKMNALPLKPALKKPKEANGRANGHADKNSR